MADDLVERAPAAGPSIARRRACFVGFPRHTDTLPSDFVGVMSAVRPYAVSQVRYPHTPDGLNLSARAVALVTTPRHWYSRRRVRRSQWGVDRHDSQATRPYIFRVCVFCEKEFTLWSGGVD